MNTTDTRIQLKVPVTDLDIGGGEFSDVIDRVMADAEFTLDTIRQAHLYFPRERESNEYGSVGAAPFVVGVELQKRISEAAYAKRDAGKRMVGVHLSVGVHHMNLDVELVTNRDGIVCANLVWENSAKLKRVVDAIELLHGKGTAKSVNLALQTHVGWAALIAGNAQELDHAVAH